MRLAVAINGSLIAHHAALLGLRFAQALGANVDVLHVKTEQDDPGEVIRSIDRLSREAAELGVPLEAILLEGGDPVHLVRKVVLENDYPFLFCSTRARKPRLFTESFSEQLVRAERPCHIAVVRVKSMNALLDVNRIALFGDGGLPSFSEFNLGLGLAKAWDARLFLIHSIRISGKKMARLTFSDKRALLKKEDLAFEPFETNARIAKVSATLIHMLEKREWEASNHYLISRGFQLLISKAPAIHGLRWDFESSSEEAFFQTCPINSLIFYAKN